VTERPHSAAAERNREPIARVLPGLLDERGGMLLEIGSGTGQHAVHLAGRLPNWRWKPTEHPAELATLRAGLDGVAPDNVLEPIALDVAGDWPAGPYQAVYSANTAHIMHWPEVEAMFAGVGRVLAAGGRFVLYGPFNRDGRFTAPSNADFDAMLRGRDPGMGLRDLAQLDALAHRAGLERVAELAMPANNLMLMFESTATGPS